MFLKRLWHDMAHHKALWLMILPTLLFFLVFSYLPMAGVYFAFTEYKFQLGYFGSPFVGLKNFEFLFKSGILGSLTVNTILYNLAFIFFQNLCQVICAVFLNDLRSRRFVRISQTLIFLPYFISMVLVGVFAYNLLNIDNGIINTLLTSLGMETYNFYMAPKVWPFIIIFAHVWKGLGYGTIIYLSSLTGINPEYYETARIDGATKWQQIRYITMPMLMPTIALLIMFSLGSIMKGQFELFYQLIGRNGVLYAATDIIDTYVYRSLMVNFNIGMGTAAGLYQSVFGFVFVMTVNWLVRRYEPSYALFQEGGKMIQNTIRPDKGTVTFQTIGYIVMILITILCVIPFWLMITGSVSDEADIIANGFAFWPRKFSMHAYRTIFVSGGKIFTAYKNTIIITVTGTTLALALTSMSGYVLQRQDFRYRNALAFFIYFTTLFSGGLVPWYIMIVQMGMKNTMYALIIPALLSPWYIMLMRNFIRSIPYSIVEAAKIDGAGDLGTYMRIILPLSKAGLAAIGMFIALHYWNNWYLANLFMKDEAGYPLQYLLYQLLSNAEYLKSSAAANIDISAVQAPAETMKLATAVVVTGPILLLYPFVQRYFVKGVTIGAVKG